MGANRSLPHAERGYYHQVTKAQRCMRVREAFFFLRSERLRRHRLRRIEGRDQAKSNTDDGIFLSLSLSLSFFSKRDEQIPYAVQLSRGYPRALSSDRTRTFSSVKGERERQAERSKKKKKKRKQQVFSSLPFVKSVAKSILIAPFHRCKVKPSLCLCGAKKATRAATRKKRRIMIYCPFEGERKSHHHLQ